ncbi:type 2A phosphatase activator Tip41p [Trichomonascus vanleenenianus]|uniref:Tip41p n=1 Tax=Trichomonascus vanleenenianus TaxID=2268995 RepID=UPI003ECAB1CC
MDITTKFKAKTSEWKGHGWRVYSKKGPILKSEEIDAAQEKLGIPIPEMIFGNNEVGVCHEPSGWTLRFDGLEALDRVDKTGEKGLVQVAYSKSWMKSRENRQKSAAGEDIQGIVKPFDWTYTTDYRGSCTGEFVSDRQKPGIPFELLKRPDPILYFDDVSLYEDELGDNGIVSLNVKVRVMPERMLLLSRFFLRVDDVLVRVRDTRVYVEFEDNSVIREYQEQEGKYDEVKAKVPPGTVDFGPFLRDPNWVSSQLSTQLHEVEHGILN